MFAWPQSVFYSLVHSSILAWYSYLANVTNESFFNFVKTLPRGVRPFGTAWESLCGPKFHHWPGKQILKYQFAFSPQSVVAGCEKWQVRRLPPIQTVALSIHLPRQSTRLFLSTESPSKTSLFRMSLHDVNIHLHYYIHVYICIHVLYHSHRYRHLKSCLIMITFLESCVASVAQKALRGKDLKTHGEFMSVHNNYLFLFPPQT